jgi:hypothetical protein
VGREERQFKLESRMCSHKKNVSGEQETLKNTESFHREFNPIRVFLPGDY